MRIWAAFMILLASHAYGQDLYCVEAHEYTRTMGNAVSIEKDKYRGEISLCFKENTFIITLNGDVKILKVEGHAHRESQSMKGYMEDRVECEEGYSVIITYAEPGVVHVVGSSEKAGATYGYTFTSNKLPVIRTEDEAKPQQHVVDSVKEGK